MLGRGKHMCSRYLISSHLPLLLRFYVLFQPYEPPDEGATSFGHVYTMTSKHVSADPPLSAHGSR